MALNQITKFRLPGTDVEVALVDWTHRPLFSTADFQTGFTQQTTILFNYVVGDSVPGSSPAASPTFRTASLNDTNISTPGTMSSTEEMLVYSVRVEMFDLDMTDTSGDFTTADEKLEMEPVMRPQVLGVLHRSLLLQLQISQKIYVEAGIGWFIPGFGPMATMTTRSLAGTGTALATNGLPGHNSAQSFAIPHHIGGQEKYAVIINNPSGAAIDFALSEATPPVDDQSREVRMRVYLDGLYKRPVS